MSKWTPKRSQGRPHLLEHQLDPAAPDRLEVGRVDALGGDPLGELVDVLAFVAVLGRLLAAHPGGDRVGEALIWAPASLT